LLIDTCFLVSSYNQRIVSCSKKTPSAAHTIPDRSSSTAIDMDAVKQIPSPPPSPGSLPQDIKFAHVEHRRNSSEGTVTTSPFAEHGPTINRSQTKEAFIKKKSKNAGLRWPRIRRLFREPFSEFMGTFILIMFGDGVVAQVVLSNGEKGNYQSISWGWVSTRSFLIDPRLLY